MWKDVKYEAGTIRAIAYKSGSEIASAERKTTGKAYSLRLSADRLKLNTGGRDLSYILVEAYDENGLSHPLAENEVTISLSGPAKIAGVGNGNPQSFRPFQSDKVKLFYGKAMIIIGSEKERGKVKISVQADGLQSDLLELTIE